MTLATTSGKVVGFESDCIDTSSPRSYEDTSKGFDANDARRHKSYKKYYDLNFLLEDFLLNLRF